MFRYIYGARILLVVLFQRYLQISSRSDCVRMDERVISDVQASVKSFLKGLHSQSTFLVPKWIAFLPAIPFFHLDCDQIRNPFFAILLYYYVH